MKDNKGMGYIKMIILMIIIAVLVAGGIYFVRVKINNEHIETIKTNMLKIDWKIKDYEGSKTVAKEEVTYIGTKVSDMQNDPIVAKLLSENVIDSASYDKYYVLTDSDLAKLGIEITNEKDSYYIVNYETDDIIITEGCTYNKNKTLYKLSDIQAEK